METHNEVVYTCTGRIKQDYRPDVPVRTWESQPRNTDEKVLKAKQALAAMYATRAAAVGLSLETYAKRFQINLTK